MIFRAARIHFDSLRWKTVKIRPMFWIVKCTLCASPPELEAGLLDSESYGNFPADFPVQRIGLFVCPASAALHISLPYILMLMKEMGTGMERHDVNRWAWERRLPVIYLVFGACPEELFSHMLRFRFCWKKTFARIGTAKWKVVPFQRFKAIRKRFFPTSSTLICNENFASKDSPPSA